MVIVYNVQIIMCLMRWAFVVRSHLNVRSLIEQLVSVSSVTWGMRYLMGNV